MKGTSAENRIEQFLKSPNGAHMAGRSYRYLLWRRWVDLPCRFVCFVMLNPSTADDEKDDATIRRCIKFADSWGYGGLLVVNLFAYRATDPKDLPGPSLAVGAGNDYWIEAAARYARSVVVAWGANQTAGRDVEVVELLRSLPVRLECLGTTKSGAPRHPLRLRASTTPWQFI